jgi:hypothetical protein
MPTLTLSPIPTGGAGGGQVNYRTNATTIIVRPPAGNLLEVGSFISGKIVIAWGFHLRFEVDLPVGTIFAGVRLSHYVFSTAGSGSKGHTFGILNHDVMGDWTGSDGWAHSSYVRASDIEVPVWAGLFRDTAYYGNNGHRVQANPASYGANDRLAIGSGTLSGEIDPAGLLAEFQAWFDDKESLRDGGVGDGIPVSFAYASNNLGAHNTFNFYDETDGTYAPILELDYTLPGPVIESLTARGVIEATISARSSISVTLGARGVIEQTLIARAKVEPMISARAVIEPTIKARGRIGR